MEYRQMGRSGLQVSVVGLGCNNFGMVLDAQQSQQVVHAALDQGVTLFDTADIYGGEAGESERMLGQALGARRQECIVATKFGSPMPDGGKGASRRYIVAAAEASLRRLDTDYIDLYQIHRPDPLTPLEETLRALDDLVRSGKVRYIGCSNFSSWQVAETDWLSRTLGLERFVSAQNRYSLLSRQIEGDLLPACRHYGLGVLPFFPLESGLLSGKYQAGKAPPEGTRWHAWKDKGEFAASFWSDRRFEQAGQLAEICAAADRSLLELAFGWLLREPAVSSVIAGATKVEQIAGNVAAAAYQPDADVMKAVDSVVEPGRSEAAW